MIPTAQSRTKDAVSAEQMLDICGQLRKEFDFVLIDSPAGIEAGFRNAAAGADEALVVTTPEVSAVRDADRIIGLLESMEKAPISLIINRIKPDMVKRGDMLSTEDVLDTLAVDLIGVVPDDESVVTSSNKGEPLTFSNSSRATKAFKYSEEDLRQRSPLWTSPTIKGLLFFTQKNFRQLGGECCV